MDRKRYLAVATSLALALAVPTGALAAANPNPSGHGLPTQSCEDQPMGPAGFDTPGFANAQANYNPISQYDVACFQVSQPH
jgi:hypothetical protein